ncbi:uncharacterized protein TRIADDRAFT_27419 [Trichoplax adhaerens]|uniref:Uncharacterized protein n=1 Tax=Trichoplax adhaerens TaxID=10228 RepID=B3S1B7_TRIAD|nr:hypothetical protein TRIADDRAFT_27419 [Trichoplax adhaerens]EDV23533.1 hypothetical protein TRIADDRAFT_27419 [Trichoplax adhaerens]|eukprot:XP_002114443.1 hypothetical protein TRIADDRAFT_27419 [Trichoplax adhaerens]
MFSQTSTNNFWPKNQNQTSNNPNKDVEVVSPPSDSVSSLAFSPPSNNAIFLVATSWDNNVSCWQINGDGTSQPKAQQSHSGPVLDSSWQHDGTKIYTGSCDKTCKMWDLQSNQFVTVGQHDAPIKTVNWINTPKYSCVLTGSWDKTLKFWDTRSPQPMLVIQLSERCYCADVLYPMAMVGTAERTLICYNLEGTPTEYKSRCISIFKDKKEAPTGFCVGSIEGRVAVQYIQASNSKDNFTFKCHRDNKASGGLDIYPVNAIARHPIHGTIATCGSDGRFSLWDTLSRTKLKGSEQMDQPVTTCTFDPQGNLFAYATGYDWSRGHEFANSQKGSKIYLRYVAEEAKPRKKR